MFFSYFTLFVALTLSSIAAWYSIVGLTAIFAAAVVPVIIMGGALEVAKITATVWLHQYWDQARWLMRLYLTSSVIILMIITSMGIFGFLSRAHIEQNAPIGDSMAQMEIIDERIVIEQEIVEQYRRDLTILNQQIERFSELGAVTRGVNARAAQQKERQAIFDRIEQSQQTITDLRQQRAPFAADVRKIETEVGPIKYIAALIYGDNPDQNLLEKAVRWVIILLVVVFDPLAIMLVLAGVESIKWNRQHHRPRHTPPGPDHEHPPSQQIEQPPLQALSEDSQSILEKHPYLTKPFAHFKNLQPMVGNTSNTPQQEEEETEENPHVKAAMREWKQHHPGQTVKHQRDLLAQGSIDQLPWLAYVEAVPDATTTAQQYLGTEFPSSAKKGDTFVKLDSRPSKFYKFNGTKWIEVDKLKSDLYTYNTVYIDWLIEKLSAGEYDPDLLTDSEQEQITERIKQNKGNQ
jgi:hypothetical protein